MATKLLEKKIEIPFEDLNPFTAGGYTVTNEEPMKHHQLIKNLKINRAAAICSAGEVQLFSILPLVKEELILVDHSYDSMYYAMVKFLLLADLGAEETYRLMTTKGEESFKELSKHITRLQKKIPSKEISRYGHNNGYKNGFGVQIYDHSNSYSKPTNKYELSNSISSVWSRISLNLVKKAADKLHLVKFVHGDMTDLTDRGPFDLFYISNATPSGGRIPRERQIGAYSPSVTQELFDLFTRSVKKRGYILSSQQNQFCGTLKKKVEPTYGLSSWRYHLYQV